jgi:hypothetical protein
MNLLLRVRSEAGHTVYMLNVQMYNNNNIFLFSAAIWHGGALSLRQISSHHATPFSIPTAHFPFWRFARV